MSNNFWNPTLLFPYSLNRRAFLAQSAAVFAATFFSSCGGGGNPSTSAPTPTPSPTAALSLVSISSITPTALSPIVVKLSGFDSTKPFTVSLSDPAGNQIPQTPIRFQSDGTIVIAAPLHIDATAGSTAPFSTTLTITQNGSAAGSAIVINDLPQLADLGVPLGLVSRAFLIYQEIALGQSINAQQAISLLPTGATSNGTLLINLKTQLLNVIKARNDIDRIVSGKTLSISIGSTPDGTPLSFDSNSIAIMDRIIAQYLLTNTNNGTQIPQTAKLQTRRHGKRLKISKEIETLSSQSSAGLASIVHAINGAPGVISYFTQEQSLTTNESTLDSLLSYVSNKASLVSGGAGFVALGATAIGAPAIIATAAGAFAAGATLVGLVCCAAAIGNDIYNIATNVYGLVYNEPGSSIGNVGKAVSALTTDTFVSYLNAEGLGGLTTGLSSATGTIYGGILKATITDVQLGFTALLVSTDNLLIQKALSDDADNAVNSAQSIGTSTFGRVDGTVSVSNSQGPTLAGLTGIGVGNAATGTIDITSIAAPDGTYSFVLPIGSPSLAYTNMDITAFDPVGYYDPAAGGVIDLASSVVDLSGVNPNAPVIGPSLVGTCNDTDAGSPDGDDPDCD